MVGVNKVILDDHLNTTEVGSVVCKKRGVTSMPDSKNDFCNRTQIDPHGFVTIKVLSKSSRS